MSAYEITATKFRPQIFEELIGQEFVVTTLKNSILKNKIANAYLLSGPRGCGKTSTARIIAKALNCVNGPTISPCNSCSNCISITNGNNSDVLEIDGASNTGINDIRAIQEEILYPPVNSKYKIYIIDEVHMLSKSAFNALLKTIEEPPNNVVFIFATTEINKVLPTIRSRCQQFNLRLIPVDLIFKSLIHILDILNIKYDKESILWIANEGKGSMRDSQTLLDQVISFCDNDISLKKIQEKIGLVGEERISLLVKMIIKKERELILKEYFSLIESGISPEQIIFELIKFFKNILIFKANINEKHFSGINKSLYEDYFINNFTFEEIENILEILFQTYEKSRYSIDIQTEIEVCFFKLIKYKDLIRPKQILEQIENLNILLLKGSMSISENTSNNQKYSIENSTKGIIIEGEKSDILKQIKKNINPQEFQLIAALNNITYIEEVDNKMILYFSQKMHFDTTCKYKDLLEKDVYSIIGKKYILEIILKSDQIQNKKSSAEINLQKIKNIFNGKEIN
jgi:DNA polymerase III subunit gamma/tau